MVLFVASGAVVFTSLTTVNAELLSHYPIYGLVILAGLTLETSKRRRALAQFDPLFQGFFGQHGVTLRQLAYSVGLLICYLALVKDHVIARSFLIVYVPVLYCGLLISNRYLPRRMAQRIFRGLREERTLFIGPASRLARMREWASQKAVLGVEVAGVLTEGLAAEVEAEGFRYLGEPAGVEEVIERQSITQVVVLELPQTRETHRALVAMLERLGVRLLIQNNLEEMLAHPVVNVEDDGMSFIGLREEPLEDPLNRIMKRLLDLAVTVPVVVLVLPPLALLVWLLQRWQSPGPLFFRQQRAGIQNQEFTILKFRTMKCGNADEQRQATRNDDRIYPAGAWLRRLSLDEVPQFLNVWKGDMSVIGPRPHLLEHNVQFASQMANYHIRASVKPGITGLAQVRGFRGEVCSPKEIAHRLESDISYLENWRFVLDLGIIARTAWQMLRPSRNAY